MVTAFELFEALNSRDIHADPYPLYRRFRESGQVIEVADNFLVATSYQAVAAVLRDASFGMDQTAALPIPDPRSLLKTNPPDHTRMRRPMAGAFTPRRVARLHDAITAQAIALIDAMRAKDGEADLIADFAAPLPLNVICELLGVPERDRGWFRPVAQDYTVAVEGSPAPHERAMALDAAHLIRAYLSHLVQIRRGDPKDDLITDLATTADLSHDELLGNLALLLIAGFETTTHLIGNGVMALLRHPQPLDDPDPFIEEVLRYDSPVQLTTRVALTPTILNGQPVAAGSYVMALIGSANRDPSRFVDPDRFDPGRPNNAPLSFGAGAHFCLGAGLARLEARIAFPLLMRSLPDLRLAGEPVRHGRLVFRGFQSLPIAWTPGPQ